MKTVCETLGVARSNIATRAAGSPSRARGRPPLPDRELNRYGATAVLVRALQQSSPAQCFRISIAARVHQLAISNLSMSGLLGATPPFDKHGNPIDFLLTAKRDLDAAKRFFRKMLKDEPLLSPAKIGRTAPTPFRHDQDVSRRWTPASGSGSLCHQTSPAR